eukprot:1095640_1
MWLLCLQPTRMDVLGSFKMVLKNATQQGSRINKKSRELHLKYHAEKKALAVLLQNGYDHEANLSVAISLKICKDCHQFFGAMSRFYGRTITCYDTNGKHVFIDGVCTLCNDPVKH